MAAPTFPTKVVATLHTTLARRYSREPAQVLQADMAIRNIIVSKLSDTSTPARTQTIQALHQGDPQMLPWVMELLSTISSEGTLLSVLENTNSSNNDFIIAERLAWTRRAELENLDLSIVPWLAMMRDYNMAEAVARWHSTDDHSVMALGVYARDIMLDPSKPLPALTKEQEQELEDLVESHGKPAERRRYPYRQASKPHQSDPKSA